MSLHPGVGLLAPCAPQGLCGVLLGAVVLSEGSADGGGDGGPPEGQGPLSPEAAGSLTPE